MGNIHNRFLILVMYTLIIYTNQQKHDPAFMESYGKYLSAYAKEVDLEEGYVKTIWNQNDIPNDPKLKCYVKCMGLRLVILTETGDTIDDVLKSVSLEFVDDATDREILKECGAIKGPDLCDTAYKLVDFIKAVELE